MLTPVLSILCSIPGPAPAPAPPAADGPRVGQVAPPHGAREWAAGAGAELADLAGKVVVIHTLAWDDEPSLGTVARLVVDLAAANADRGLTAMALVARDDGADPPVRAERAGITHPVAIVEPGASPYFDPAADGFGQVFLVGRSGEIAWRGSAIDDEKGLLAAAGAALATLGATPLERDLAPALGQATALYFGGEWARARKLAGRVGKREKRDPLARDDAAYLVGTIDDFEHECTQRLGTLTRMRDEIEFCTLYAAVQRGFPRSAAVAAGEEVIDGKRREIGFVTFVEARKWVELEAERPVLFPARKSSAGKRHAKKLEALLRASWNRTGVQLRAQKLLAAWALAE